MTVRCLPPPHAQGPPLTEATETAFRQTMREFASGVCILTTGSGDDRAGLTATSVASLSVEPPTLLVCVHRASSSYPVISQFGAFAVNVLAADQHEYAERFAGDSGQRGSERYRGGRWQTLPSGVACLADSVAVFDCEVDEIIERHTHAIVIGRVRRLMVGAGSGALVYWRGAYDQVGWSNDEISRAIGISPGDGKLARSKRTMSAVTKTVCRTQPQLCPFHGTSQRSMRRMAKENAKAQRAMMPMPTKT
jgi:flavin reductase (DIM6/NTAB) family NADH-FMN oxidoreductase RutF